MKVKQLIEAKYAANESWWDLMPDTFTDGSVALQFAQENKKILEKLFIEMKRSFKFFAELSIDMMDDQPDDYEERDYDAEQLAKYWHDQTIDSFALEDESAIYQWLESRVNKTMLTDVMSVMGDYIVRNAQEVFDET